jgi:shikimate kinase
VKDEPESVETLCDYCANKADCNEHHQMCVNFESVSGGNVRYNIVLIGPPGVGKSTVGVLLAKALSIPFVDTDILIQAAEGRRLQDILDAEGVDGFREVEERHILALDLDSHVIATGGSVVYSPSAMNHLKSCGKLVFLDLPCEELLKRIEDLDTRGVVFPASQTFPEMYHERLPLYQRYADFMLDCTGLSHQQVVQRIKEFALQELPHLHCG